jgi:hypothetical protein
MTTPTAAEAFGHIKTWVEALVKREVGESDYRRNHTDLKGVAPLRQAADDAEAKLREALDVPPPAAPTSQDATHAESGTAQ